MATSRFTGIVRSYGESDDGGIFISVDEITHNEQAVNDVNELVRNFNPSSSTHGFGARDVPCRVKPGFAGYSFRLTREEAQGIGHGTRVLVEVDFYNVKKVLFMKRGGGNGGAGRWAGIPELRYNLLSIRPDNNYSHENKHEAKAEKSAAK